MPARDFASDNHAPALPEVMEAVAAANAGRAPAYGADPWSDRLAEVVREQFGARTAIWPVFNGTGANVLALRAACRPWDAVVCTADAHVHTDECGAPEALAGLKLLALPAPHGRLSAEQVAAALAAPASPHLRRPRVVTLTQGTELGTLYPAAEVGAIADAVHAAGGLLHVDGARLFNAASALGVEPAALTAEVGVDLLSLGATKVGALGAEAVLAFGDAIDAEGMAALRKQTAQLASKQRFVAAQLLAVLEDRRWAPAAAQANAMAARLAGRVGGLDGVEVVHPVEANAVFARLPARAVAALREAWAFHVWRPDVDEVRWMCAWDTRPEDVDAFADAVAAAVAAV